MDEIKTISVDEEVFCLMAGKAVKAVADKRLRKNSLTGNLMIAIMEEAVTGMWQMLKELDAENKLLKEDEQTAGKQDQEELKEKIIQRLWKDARYAVNSYDMNLLYQTLGELHMAVDGGLVTYGEVREIDQYIIPQHMNNPDWFRKCEGYG